LIENQQSRHAHEPRVGGVYRVIDVTRAVPRIDVTRTILRIVAAPATLALVTGILLASTDARAQRSEPTVHGVFDGDSMYTVLPPNTIPAIMAPEFVSGQEAMAQMQPDEMVLGVQIEGDARAYSLWQLDAHEIVNDTVGGVPLAATW